jgi:hypothetical protein
MTLETEQDVATVVKALKSNRFEPVIHVKTAEEAGKKALEMIPPDAKVGMGGSTSLMQTGLLEELRKRGNMTLARPDIYLTSSNAITLDGKLVNTDMTGNRVSSMIFGPKQVIVIAGMNKVVKDLHAAWDRIKNVITPHIAKSSGVRTPCATEGKCSDCKSPMRLCSVTTIIEAKPRVTQISIILTDEDMGLSWDPAWEPERIQKIQSIFGEKWAALRAARQPAS